MIVRIATEDQYRIPDSDQEELARLDDEVVAAVEANDEEAFSKIFTALIDLVRKDGNKLGDDELEESDVILPPPDLSFAEAQKEFSGEGLIPD